MSDPVLTGVPSCGKPAFKKQLTAAGFQLKGTGWYATDFRGGSAPSTGTADRACRQRRHRQPPLRQPAHSAPRRAATTSTD